MGGVLLTAAMIVRDEEANLPACLESIKDVVDEIVIVDTGSTDRTVSIARSFGARIEHHPWNGSLAEPRNLSLELARGEWILYIDADERLRPISRDAVHARLRAAHELALMVLLRPFTGATPFREYRMWRSDPRIRFVGKIHEKVTPAIAVLEAKGEKIGDSELFLEHVGYDGDQTHKHRRNLPLLQAQLAEKPVDAYAWHHLVRVLDGLGEDDESEAALERAVQIARETGGPAGVLPFLKLIEHRQRRGQDATAVLAEALSRHPDNFGLWWLKVLEELGARQYRQALRRLEGFDVDPELPVEDTTAYPGEMFGARAAEARGLCLFKLGRYVESAEAYGRAERLEPDTPEHRLKRVLAEHRAGNSPPAVPRAASAAHGYGWPARALLHGLTLDIGGVSVGVTATDAMRAIAVHELLGRMPPSGRDAEVHLLFDGHWVPPPDRPPDDRNGALQLWTDDEALSLAYGRSFGGRVEGCRATIGGYSADLRGLFHQAGPFVLASLLAERGHFLLHAGAIQRHGRAVLILGSTGSGKSTAVLGALQEGWSILSDDLVVVRNDQRGAVVSGIPRRLAVPAEVLRGDEPPSLFTDSRARAHLCFEAWDRAAYPVGAIAVMRHGETAAPVLEPIERPQLLGLLIYAIVSQRRIHVRRSLPLAAELSDVPAFWLYHAGRPEHRPRQAAIALAACLNAQRSS